MILKHTAIDTIIQSSTVELMHSHSVSVAPRSREEALNEPCSDSEIAGVVSFDGPNIRGGLTVAIPETVYRLMVQRRPQKTTHAEWMYEITNQVMGRIKNRLIQFQVKLRTSFPVVLSGEALQRHKQQRAVDRVVYSFATLRGEITVTVDASLTRAVLEYSNAPLVLTECDLVLFD
jgi:CheY-specific phosphatase CheX